MASSQVEIVPPSHFGCILKKLNHKDMSKDKNSDSKTTLKNNIKEFVRDQFQSCIPATSETSNINATKKCQPNRNFDLNCWGKSNISYKKGYDEDAMIPMYKKQSRVLDEWAAQQAKDMINTTERQNEEIDDFHSLSKSRSVSSRESSIFREPSPTPSDNSSTDFSVSSLVQKWRGFEAVSRHIQSNSNNNNNSNVNIIHGHVISHEHQENMKDARTSQEQTQEKRQVQHEQIQLDSISSSVDGKEEERKEEERMRVIDIVRRLANSNQGVNDEVNQECKSFICSSLMSLKVGMDIKDQQGIFAAVVSSPKLRGRQAISDFIKRMERHRYQEVEELKCRQPVTKFPYRGRIQSLLRFKFLRRDVFAHNDQYIRVVPKKYESAQSETSNIRKKYGTTKNQETNTVKSSVEDLTYINQDQEKAPSSKDKCKRDIFEKDSNIERQDAKTSSCPSDNSNNDDKCILIQEKLNKKEESKFYCESNQVQNDNVIQSQSDETTQQPFCDDNVAKCASVDVVSTNTIQTECSSSNDVLEQHNLNEEDKMHDVKNSPVTHIGNEDEEQEDNEDEEDEDEEVLEQEDEEEEEEEEEIMVEQQDDNLNILVPNLDWTIDIARPRSYWEDIRQTWYQEIFNTHPQDEEIRQLLERGSVSSVLASDFRERMDQIVTSSIQRVFYSTTIEEDEESFKFIDDVDNNDETINEFMNHPAIEYDNHQEEQQNNVCDHEYSPRLDEHQRGETEDDIVEVDEDDDEGDEPSTSRQKYHDIIEDYDQTPSQFPWIHYHDQETSEDSENVASTSVQKTSRYDSYYRDTRQGSPLKNFSSIEMELIFDLKAHMHQLHDEMAELRKTITTCMDMQLKFQQSFIEGIHPASNLDEQRKRKIANARNTTTSNCCICYKRPVDSVLYRCGHMCTCINCAKELEWNSEKCPKCQAQVIDIVQIRSDA
ncbi:hypothetical protein vseg_003623 [Gypsophila vaccaria]